MSEKPPTYTLHFSNLSYETDERALRAEVEKYGKPTDIRIPNGRHGLKKGFAFVEFETEDLSRDVMQALNNTDLDGRRIVVEPARSKPHPPRDRDDDRRDRDSRRYRRERSPSPRPRRRRSYYNDYSDYDERRRRRSHSSRRSRYHDYYSDDEPPRRRAYDSPPRRERSARRKSNSSSD